MAGSSCPPATIRSSSPLPIGDPAARASVAPADLDVALQAGERLVAVAGEVAVEDAEREVDERALVVELHRALERSHRRVVAAELGQREPEVGVRDGALSVELDGGAEVLQRLERLVLA